MTSKEFNWDRKISLKEIAQFYEDRLRELDTKRESIVAEIESLRSHLNLLKAKSDEVMHFISQYDDLRNLMQSERQITLDSVYKTLDSMNEQAFKKFKSESEKHNQELVKAIKDAQIGSYIRSRLEMDILADAFFSFLIQYHPDAFKSYVKGFREAKAESYLPATEGYVSGDVDSRELRLTVIKSMINDYSDMFTAMIKTAEMLSGRRFL